MKMTCSPHRPLAAFASAAIALAWAGCAGAAVVYNPGHLPAAAMKRIEAACAMVARLPNGSAYDLGVCEASLSRSLAARLGAGASGPTEAQLTPVDLAVGPHATRRQREERACAAIGLEPAGLAFGQCVADLDAELFAADRPIM